MKISESLKYIAIVTFRIIWPPIWRILKSVYSLIPVGKFKSQYKKLLFGIFWSLIYPHIYGKLRDVLFELVLIYFYNYEFKKGDTIVQIGASEGKETVRLAKAVGTTGRIIAIEPEEKNLKVLNYKIEKMRLTNVTIIPIGVWNERKKVRFYLGRPREHRIAELEAIQFSYEWLGNEYYLEENFYTGSTEFSVDTLDNILKCMDLNGINFILIEVNGAELEVVKGMGETLNKVKALAIRGHAKLDGICISNAIATKLNKKGFEVTINSEGMVLASKKH